MLTKFLFELDDYQEDDHPINPFKFLESFSEEEFDDGTVYHALSTIYNFTPD